MTVANGDACGGCRSRSAGPPASGSRRWTWRAEKKKVSKEQVIEEFLATRRPHIEVGRPGRVEEVGPVVAFLCSERASFVNGANYRVDGGSVASV